MTNRCIHCNEAWGHDDYTCPCCNRAAIEQDSDMTPTLKYIGITKTGHRIDIMHRDMVHYDVIRLSTNKSIFDEPNNYTNKERERR